QRDSGRLCPICVGCYRRLIPLVAMLGCSSAARPTNTPRPQSQRYTHRDSLALASLDAFLFAKLMRNVCRMPVVRGDASHDTAMVWLGSRRRPAVPPG